MNTTKLRNAGNFALFVSWLILIAAMVVASTCQAGWAFLVVVAGIALSVLLNSKYSSKVVEGIEELQKEVNSLTKSLESSKSKAAEWESKYDKASSDLSDAKAEIESLKSQIGSLNADKAADASATAGTSSSSKKSSKKK